MSISILLWAVLSMAAVIILYSTTHVRLLWRHHTLIADICIALLLVATVMLLTDWSHPFLTLSALSIQISALVTTARMKVNRLHDMQLRHSTRFESSWLPTLYPALIALSFLPTELFYSGLLTLFIALSSSWALYSFGKIILSTKRFYPDSHQTSRSLAELPTVTLAIPARNETHALTESLQAAIQSTYPKLEIVVLDDCSHDSTSQLIRAFAHDGVRFIQGDEPTSDWLGKNKALKALRANASGEYIIFSGIDTKFSPESVTRMIEYMLDHHVAMISVLPQRWDSYRPSTLLQQLRYYWQVTNPSVRSVPASTSVWCIKTATLDELGGFNAVKNKIIPEQVFARDLYAKKLYHFLISNGTLGIHTEKKWSSQRDTAIRTLYPSLRRSPLSATAAKVALLVLLSPYLLSFALIVTMNMATLLFVVSISVSIVLSTAYAIFLRASSPYVWMVGFVSFPILLVQEIILITVSMLKYEFGEVNWKGRNVCYPALDRPARTQKSTTS